MNDLSAFPITNKWPPQHPDRLQLYSLPTPNGVKASIMLEETGLRNLFGFYEAGDLVGFGDFKHVARVLATFVARPAVTRGLNIPAAPKPAP